MPIGEGTRLGNYEVVGTVGKGGMGEVYRARDIALSRPIALKVLPPEASSDSDALARFEQEARATSSLNHPHIVQVFELASVEHEGEELKFIAMELVEGRSLREHLVGSTPLGDILEILAQVADALDKAHVNGIVHRDIKPENVIVTSDGYAKVVDFGIAKLTGSSDQRARTLGPAPTDAPTTEAGSILGTLAYMAPEQIRGGDIDGRADVFALGNIIFEAVMGYAPFRRESAAKTIHSIMNDPVPEHTDPKRLAPLSIERIVRRCLAKKAEDRYESAREVAELLRSIRKEMLLDPTAWAPVERLWLSRRATQIATAAIALLVLGLIFLASRM